MICLVCYREEVASCCERAYTKLSVSEAQKLMMFDSPAAVLDYAKQVSVMMTLQVLVAYYVSSLQFCFTARPCLHRILEHAAHFRLYFRLIDRFRNALWMFVCGTGLPRTCE